MIRTDPEMQGVAAMPHMARFLRRLLRRLLRPLGVEAPPACCRCRNLPALTGRAGCRAPAPVRVEPSSVALCFGLLFSEPRTPALPEHAQFVSSC